MIFIGVGSPRLGCSGAVGEQRCQWTRFWRSYPEAVLRAEIIGWNIVEERLRLWSPHLGWSLCPRDAEGISDFENFLFIGEEGDLSRRSLARRWKILICPLQRGHSKGSISKMRFMHAAHLTDG